MTRGGAALGMTRLPREDQRATCGLCGGSVAAYGHDDRACAGRLAHRVRAGRVGLSFADGCIAEFPGALWVTTCPPDDPDVDIVQRITYVALTDGEAAALMRPAADDADASPDDDWEPDYDPADIEARPGPSA